MTTETKRQTTDSIQQAEFNPNRQDPVAHPDVHSVFFFDGDFRTSRARLNGAISNHIACSRWN